jgi:hypothetical protein
VWTLERAGDLRRKEGINEFETRYMREALSTITKRPQITKYNYLRIMLNLKRVRNIVLLIILLGFIGYIISICYQLNQSVSADPPVVTNSIPKDYTSLFSKIYNEKFVVRTSFNYKYRSAICLFSYTDSYALEMIKIDSSFNLPVGKIIYESSNSTIETNGAIYTPFDEFGFKTDYLSKGSNKISKINLTLFGDSLKTIVKNDSIVNYNLKLKNLSVSYNSSNVEAIFCDASEGLNQFSEIPLSIAFVKKKGSLYFILFAPKTSNLKFDQSLLYNLVSQK